MGELLLQGNPMSSSQMSFSIQRMLVHMDTMGERQQDKFTRVQENFERVGQCRTQNMLEEEEKIHQLQDREKAIRKLGLEDDRQAEVLIMTFSVALLAL